MLGTSAAQNNKIVASTEVNIWSGCPYLNPHLVLSHPVQTCIYRYQRKSVSNVDVDLTINEALQEAYVSQHRREAQRVALNCLLKLQMLNLSTAISYLTAAT